MPDHPQRQRLPHDIPNWVEDGAVFFITICAADRSKPTLTTGTVPKILTEAIAHYHSAARWYCHLFVIMPDHIHALIALPQDEQPRVTIAQWKSDTAKVGSFRWQRDFFDHRLRAEESFDEKTHYTRQNPVRARLVESPQPGPTSGHPPAKDRADRPAPPPLCPHSSQRAAGKPHRPPNPIPPDVFGWPRPTGRPRPTW